MILKIFVLTALQLAHVLFVSSDHDSMTVEGGGANLTVMQDVQPIENVTSASSQESLANVLNGSNVSNTTFSSTVHNETVLSLLQKYRERKKQERLLLIQANIIQQLMNNRTVIASPVPVN
ncbi:hypothetical protein HDE_09446 [Halotydeus destructor]|nr:hypothetical protein HDE_09446 [Halotydeus destructor]